MLLRSIATISTFVCLAVLPSGAGAAELQIIERQIGNGDEAASGKLVKVHYSGWLFDAKASDYKGKKFDSSVDRGQAFAFPLGAGGVIRGWEEGVIGMKVGGQRTLIIPPHMAYGKRGAGGVIPPDATLVFDIELLGVRDTGGSTQR